MASETHLKSSISVETLDPRLEKNLVTRMPKKSILVFCIHNKSQ